MSKFSSIVTGIFSALSLFVCPLNASESGILAIGEKNTTQQKKSPECQGPKTTPQCPPKIAAYSAPVRVNPNAWANLYAEGSFIYYRASADYLAPALLDTSFSLDPDDLVNVIFKGSTLEPQFTYKPGYKLGLGYKTQQDFWDVYAGYTRFHQTSSSSLAVDPESERINPVWMEFVAAQLLQDSCSKYSAQWKTDFDILDAEVGRDFFCGRYLTLRPSLGLRALWIDQKYDLIYTSFTDEIPVFSNNKSSSWGIGPRFALNNQWNLYGGLKVVGDLGLSLLHVEDRVHVSQTTPVLLMIEGFTSDVLYSNKESISLVKPILDLSLGLGWDYPLFSEKCALNLEVSYDYSVYWNQGSIQLGHAPIVNPGIPIKVIVGNTALSTGDISVQGLRATARFDF